MVLKSLVSSFINQITCDQKEQHKERERREIRQIFEVAAERK